MNENTFMAVLLTVPLLQLSKLGELMDQVCDKETADEFRSGYDRLLLLHKRLGGEISERAAKETGMDFEQLAKDLLKAESGEN